ncbi:MAG: FAD-dependent oxidoreductase, partial [Spirulinaceae cyanobacterium RM2_2_10]|nr:FAD-dependent oxidoreductase [Spirulinaceae cyanobacterium RM2_2_10]
MSQESPSLLSTPISRRAAITLMGAGAVGVSLGYSRLAKPQPTIYQPDNLSLPVQLQQPKQVCVIGAGLAGLAAAYELSQRGFVVTLLEKSPNLGGKIASWKINVGDEEFRMEHGFHGFFPQYYNLKSLVSELAIEENFKSLESYSLVFRSGDYEPEVFRPSHSSFPWNVIDLAISSPNRLRWGINLLKLKHLQVFRAITGFQIPRTFKTYDSIAVADWAGQDFPQGLYDLYFLPFAKSSLNAPDVLSTGELLQFFHFYFFGNPEGLAFNGTCDDMGTSLVQPLAQAIAANGGQIVPQATVSKIECTGDRITGLTYQQGDAQPDVPFWVERNELLNQNGKRYYGAGDRVYVAQSEREALCLTCTHQGCTVQPQPDGQFLCPCHGALYDAEGRVQRGPAARDLAKFAILATAGDRAQLAAVVPHAPAAEVAITADYYVLATDVGGTRHLFDLIEGDADPNLKQQVSQLALADPFAVARFWLDRDFPWEHSNFASLSGYALTDSITLYHRIQQQ